VDRPPLLLLPPSEGKTAGGRAPGRPGSFDDDLGPARAAVVAELARIVRDGDPARCAAVLGVRGELLTRALGATAALADGTAPVLPAWRRYSGVVWAALDPATLPAADRRRILVPSGLYGLTTATDPVADYRLKMSVVLGPLGRLSAFWRSEVTAALSRRARRRPVVDLLPAEHAAAVDLDALGRSTPVVRVRFVSPAGDRAVGHEAKSAKGHLARALLDDGLEAAGTFRWEGWRSRVAGDEIVVTAPKA
jgi:hypothetical protein